MRRRTGVSDAEQQRSLLEALSNSGASDVTGGMRHRLETALALARDGVSSLIAGGEAPGRLEGALRQQAVPGTWVLPPSDERPSQIDEWARRLTNLHGSPRSFRPSIGSRVRATISKLPIVDHESAISDCKPFVTSVFEG